MSRSLLRRAILGIPLALATLAGCENTDTTAPKLTSDPLLAQGDNGVWTVNSLADPGDGVCDDAHCTLREAIAAAAPGDEVVVAPGLQGTIALASALFIGKTLSVDGDGRIALDGQGNHRLFETLDVGGPIAVSLAGMTLQNGAAFGGGGGLLVGLASVVTVRNTVITRNESNFDGGGVYAAGQLTLITSTISGNQTQNRGGGIFSLGRLSLINSTVDGNNAWASGSDGGGIYSAGTLTVTGSTISKNRSFSGSGLWINSGTAALARSTISGNTSDGIVNFGALTMTSTTITNHAKVGIQNLGSAQIGNSIIAGNALGCNSASTITSLGNNLSDSCFLNAASDVGITFGQAFTHVLAQDLQDNGGPTKTHALIARGLAVDAGYCPGETADQRGFSRPVDDPTRPNANDGCDIGAFEAPGPPVADLMVSQSVDKNSVKQGELLTYTVRVQNLGPQAARDVVVNNLLSSGVTFFEARQNKGSITAPPRGETGTVTWNLGDMANQANEVAEIVVTVLVRGKTTVTNAATVTGHVADPNAANNSAAITVSVAAGSSGKKG